MSVRYFVGRSASSLFGSGASRVGVGAPFARRALKTVSKSGEETATGPATSSRRDATDRPAAIIDSAPSAAVAPTSSRHTVGTAAPGPPPVAGTDAPASPDPASYEGISSAPFPQHAQDVLLAPVDTDDIEVKPDGTVYLPEIKYRRILNRAFGPGGWAMKPVDEAQVADGIISRTYQLFCLGRFVAEARGEQQWHSRAMSRPTAEEAAKSNAVMRCCKDLGVASELWDPTFLREFRRTHLHSVWCQHVKTGEKRMLWKLKRVQEPVAYPWKET